MTKQVFRPDSTDLLFLRSFAVHFRGLSGNDKGKIHKKVNENVKGLRKKKVLYFYTHFIFTDFCQENFIIRRNKKSTEFSLKHCPYSEYNMDDLSYQRCMVKATPAKLVMS